MYQLSIRLVVLATFMFVSACDAGDDKKDDGEQASKGESKSKPTADSKPAKAEGSDKPADAPKSEAKAAPAGAGDPAPDEPATGEPAWKIEVEGRDPLTGSNMMVNKIGPVTKHSLMGATAAVTIDLNKGKPYLVQILFIETGGGEQCAQGLGGSGVTIKDGGDRYEVGGEISCNMLKEDKKRTAKISGYFPKKKK